MKYASVNVAAAKARLPELMDRAAAGETIVLARAGKPRARLMPLEDASRKLRVPGKNRLKLRRGWEKTWDALDEQVAALFSAETR